MVCAAAKDRIPQTKGMPSRRPVPWWIEQCTIANRERKTALRRYQRTRLMVDKIAYSRARAKARLVKRTAKKASWQDYVSRINDNTPAKKVWKRINKI